jgi:hypothetical protein
VCLRCGIGGGLAVWPLIEDVSGGGVGASVIAGS